MGTDELSVHLPVSLVSDSSELREKTLKIGDVGRGLAIYRVEKVFLYDDGGEDVDDVDGEAKIISSLLEYMDTPQYLRKDLFPYMEELRYAGILPPLRTPHHPLRDERNGSGDVREAAVVESGESKSRLNIGLPENGICEEKLEEGSRVTVRLGESLGGGKRSVQPVDESEIDEYWGFDVSVEDSLAQSLSNANSEYTIGTSRYGQNLYEVVDGIKKNRTGALSVAFGGPYRGLFEICEDQDVDPDDLFDEMANAIPQQGTATVRTEEALAATLAILNITLKER